MPDYRQLDGHSCGFIAALTVVHRFRPWVPTRDVFNVIRPHPDSGVASDRMIESLARFDISARYVDRLGQRRLAALLEEDIIPLVTVWPDDWWTDHWTVIRAVSEERVFCTNHRSHISGIPWWSFCREWWPRVGAIICEER